MVRTKNLIELIVIEETQHTHQEIRTDDLFSEITFTKMDGTKDTLTVQPRDLYEVGGGLFGFLKWIRYGQKKHYLMVIREDGTPIKEKDPEISGKVLRVAKDWRGLGKAIHDSFGSRFQIPRMGLVIAVGIGVAVIIFLVWRGFIPTPTSWGIGQ